MTSKRSPDKRMQAYRFGLSAEAVAAWYLRAKGYRILARRYRNAQGEIDVLAQRGALLVAVEVKARRSLAACYESVPPAKQQKIARALQGALGGESKIAGLACDAKRSIRFDVIWIVPWHWPRHLADAWRL